MSGREEAVRYFNEETILYQDDDHLNRVGAMELRRRIEPIFSGRKTA